MSIPLTGRTRLKPEGDLPYTHLADGTTELLVFSECTRRELVKMGLGKQGLLGSKIVTPYRVRAFRFIPLNDKMEDLLTPIGGTPKSVVDEGGAGDGVGDGVELGKEADEAEEGVSKGGEEGSSAVASSSEYKPGVEESTPVEDDAAPPDGEAASPAPPMTSSSSYTGDSSLPTIQRPDCLPSSHSSSTSKKELSAWTSDGEMDFNQKAITVFVHCQLLSIFGHGVEKTQSDK